MRGWNAPPAVSSPTAPQHNNAQTHVRAGLTHSHRQAVPLTRAPLIFKLSALAQPIRGWKVQRQAGRKKKEAKQQAVRLTRVMSTRTASRRQPGLSSLRCCTRHGMICGAQGRKKADDHS